MRSLSKIGLLVVAMFALAACDVLDEPMRSNVVPDAHLATPRGFEDAVRASYEILRYWYADEQGANLTVFGTDEYTEGGHGFAQFLNRYNAELNATNFAFWNTWSQFYQAINAINTVTSRAHLVDMPAARRDRLVGEVRFLRAHLYFILVRTFGPVHLTLEETVGVELESERTPLPVIYQAMIDDLQYAIEHLPAVPEQYGRVTRPAAQHMLAEVLLTRGYTEFAQPNDFENSAAMARQVINEYGFSLVPSYAALFDHDLERPPANTEVIFAVQYSDQRRLNCPPGGDPAGQTCGNRSHLFYRPHYEFYNSHLQRTLEPGYGRPWIRFRPTNWGLENFAERAFPHQEISRGEALAVDCRYNDSFQDVWYYNNPNSLPAGAAVGDTAIYVSPHPLTPAERAEVAARNPGSQVFTWAARPVNMFPSLTKFDDWRRPHVNDQAGSRDFMVYRLAETHLIAAEALYQAGRSGEAAEHINVVRRRGACPGMEAQNEIPAGVIDIDFILDERSRELFGEQKRWFDLVRTGKLVERARLHNPQARMFIQDHHVLRPIPANQITRTTSPYPQNPGY